MVCATNSPSLNNGGIGLMVRVRVIIICTRFSTLIHFRYTYLHLDTRDGSDDTVLQDTTLLVVKS